MNWRDTSLLLLPQLGGNKVSLRGNAVWLPSSMCQPIGDVRVVCQNIVK